MFNLKEEALGAALHKNLVSRLKEYARKGYEETQGSKDADFERLWQLAFQGTESEYIPPAKQQYIQYPKPF